ncbi:MAG: fumarate hydratase [Pseudothermotoga sp.]
MKIAIVDAKKLEEKLIQQLQKANTVINDYVKTQIQFYEGPFSDVLKRNIMVAEETGLPLCQDTGMVEFFVFMGYNIVFTEPLEETLNNAVKKVYSSNPFRFSVVRDPVYERKNTFDNTPAVVHIFQTQREDVEVRFLVKGGGSENLTKLFMASPSADLQEITELIVNHIKEHGAKGCPPLKVGIGIGGSADKAVVLSKLALTRSFDEPNADSRYAQLEKEIHRRLNELKIGFQGLFVGPTVYSVHVEYAPTHIANLPIAVSVDCYLCRKGVVRIEPDATQDI